MGNQTLEYVSDRLLKVLYFGLFVCLSYYLKIMETVLQYWGVGQANDSGENLEQNLL